MPSVISFANGSVVPLELADGVPRATSSRRAPTSTRQRPNSFFCRRQAADEDAPSNDRDAAVVHLAHHRVDVGKGHHQALVKNALLVVDVVVERRLVHAELVRDHVRRSTFVAIGREELRRSAQNRGALVFVACRGRSAPPPCTLACRGRVVDAGMRIGRCHHRIMRVDGPGRDEAFDLVIRHAELCKDIARVLADQGCAVAHPAGVFESLTGTPGTAGGSALPGCTLLRVWRDLLIGGMVRRARRGPLACADFRETKSGDDPQTAHLLSVSGTSMPFVSMSMKVSTTC